MSTIWKGPSLPIVVLTVLGLALPSLAISYMAVNGIPTFVKDMFRGKNRFVVKGKTVLITGASQGMGRGVANILSHKGANVILVARDIGKLQSAVEYISKAAPNPKKQRFHYISADVTKPEENTRIIHEATEWNNNKPPDIIWANAGSAKPDLFLDTPLETFKSQMDINYFAALYLAHAALTAWLLKSEDPKSTKSSESQEDEDDDEPPRRKARPAPRHFVMTSSVIAFCGMAGYTPYAPCKSAMRSLHDTLRSELQLYNGYLSHQANTTVPKVKIHTVFPGTILSPGLEEENESKHEVTKILEEGDQKQTEHEVAMAAIRGLEAGKAMIATQMLGSAMLAAGKMGSVRDSPIKDTLFGWVVAVVWLFVGPDMNRKVAKWGRDNGMPLSKQS